MSKHVREKCGKLYISSFWVPKGALLLKKFMQIDNTDTQTWSVVQKNKVIGKISVQYVKACKRKVRKTVCFQYSKFQKGHNSHKHWRKLTTLELDLYYDETKSYAKFQLNMSKHVGEKCGKVHITYILSSQRGITPSKIDAKWRQ